MTITHADLAQFTGTSQWFRHALVRTVLYTDGIQFLAERANAYWLLDKIATLQLDPKIGAEPFQVWKLEVADNIGALTCNDGGKPEHGGAARLLHFEEITTPTSRSTRSRSGWKTA
ncbi:DUF6876 family protein [Bradyrhizobium sp. Leo121]|uniref:DUF6876 family protein n=1 Tax=Bradyrhizobium sp. Leo121 TaxID=1571195 RepID=UPI001029EE87|nr:DUF6876 family protein [Bradyrhizobium sp. Leo121]RZN30501.1 hypothetical protein CWO90_20405 [Bradyrhizobium sp. Leo121]